jgi:hypothetical protein
MPNTELLNRTLKYIETHPKKWNQRHWASWTECGTAYCFAGWTVALAHPGASPDFSEGASQDGETTGYIVVDDESYDIEAMATGLLDLSQEQADALFCAANSLADLRRLVAELTAAEPALDAPAGV